MTVQSPGSSATPSHDERRPAVVVIGQLPPPFHGQSAQTAAVLEYLASCVDLEVANISPGGSKRLSRHLIRSWRTLRALRLLVLRRHGHRVLYHPVDGGSGLVYSIAVACVARLLGYSIFLHYHSFAYVYSHSWLMAVLTRILAGKATHIVLCSAMADGLRARYPTGRVYEISNAALIPPATRTTRPVRETVRLGFLSNLIVEKGLDTSIELLRAAIADGLPVELHIAGPPTDPHSLQLIEMAQRDLGPRIRYAGALYGEKKDEFLSSLDVFLFPSRYVNEAQPRVVIEALGHGLPTLTVMRGCISSDLGCTGGLCLPQGADFVARALPLIRQWCNDRNALRAASTAAHERATVLYDRALTQLSELVPLLSEGHCKRKSLPYVATQG